MKVLIRRGVTFAGSQVWLMQDNTDGTHQIVKTTELIVDATRYRDAHRLPEPTFTFSHVDTIELAKSLIEQLVENGLMPDPSMEKGELKAQREHLNDLRKYIDKLLGD